MQMDYCPLLGWHSPFSVLHNNNKHAHANTDTHSPNVDRLLALISCPSSVFLSFDAALRRAHKHAHTRAHMRTHAHTRAHTRVQMAGVRLYVIKFEFPVEIVHLVKEARSRDSENSWGLYECFTFSGNAPAGNTGLRDWFVQLGKSCVCETFWLWTNCLNLWVSGSSWRKDRILSSFMFLFCVRTWLDSFHGSFLNTGEPPKDPHSKPLRPHRWICCWLNNLSINHQDHRGCQILTPPSNLSSLQPFRVKEPFGLFSTKPNRSWNVLFWYCWAFHLF